MVQTGDRRCVLVRDPQAASAPDLHLVTPLLHFKNSRI
jgi:hypothetical protein